MSLPISIEQIRPELTWRLRHSVLYPDKRLYEMEMDEDYNGTHFGVFTNNQLVAVVSLFKNDGDYQFRKFAVLPDFQHSGIGRTLLDYITQFARNENGRRLWCNARSTAIGFYLKHGFVQTGNIFTRDGFEYEILTKALS